MVDDYDRFYLGTELTSSQLNWTGELESCNPGSISDEAREKTLQRINYYRKLGGLKTDVNFDQNLSSPCQEAALMMHKNKALSHDPPKAWDCYTSGGAGAAGKSNLARGRHSTGAIALYMIDPGSSNIHVGHRRWILYSRAKDFGMGSTTAAHALYVINNRIAAPEDLEFIAYPNRLFPRPLLPDRWSFSIPKADFTDAKVQVFTEEGHSLDLLQHPVQNGFADNTLVWEPDMSAIEMSTPYDLSFTVRVSNVNNASQAVYEYQVVLATVQYPPNCKDDLVWDDGLCLCSETETTSIPFVTGTPPYTMSQSEIDQSLHISILEEGVDMSLEIYNIQGQLLWQDTGKDSYRIETAGYAPGLYVIRGILKHKMHLEKFLVKQ